MSEMFLEQLDYKGARVLVVDDNPMNVELVADNLEQEGYAVERAFSGEEALRKVDAAPFDLVLLDVMMPGLTGYDVCERLKRDQKTRLLPVVMLTALDKREDKIRGIAAGADDFINKPFDRAELLIRVKSCIRTKRLTDDLETAESILVALGNAIDAKDTYTEGHAERVAHYSVAIGKQLGLPYEALRRLRLGGVLHDIGKIGVPEAILNKPGPLTTDEFAVMKKHPEIGERICAPLKSLREMLPVIRSHHERPNGSGYPDGLRGDEIPVEARIVCLADLYDALATTRSYKRAFTRERCIAILRDDTAKGLFDPQVVEAFVAYLSEREEAVRGRRGGSEIDWLEEPTDARDWRSGWTTRERASFTRHRVDESSGSYAWASAEASEGFRAFFWTKTRTETEKEAAVIKRYLLTPGPTPVPPEVALKMAEPIIHHRTPEFSTIFSEVRAGLKKLFQTAEDVLVLAASGTGAMEAAVVNLLSAGDRVIVVNGGKFGERWRNICQSYGVAVEEIKVEWGEGVAIDAVRSALDKFPDAKAVLVQASE